MADNAASIVCTNWRAYKKNTLRGFADLLVVKMHMTINGCMLHEKNGRAWISFPSMPRLNADGTAQRENGKVLYNKPVISFGEDVRNRFSDAAVNAILLVDKTAATIDWQAPAHGGGGEVSP